MKQFTIPCKFDNQEVHPFFVYAGEPNPENHPLKYQSHWLREEQNATIPKKVMDSMKKLQLIAYRNHISFEELCVYALHAHQVQKNQTPGVAGGSETIEDQMGLPPQSQGSFQLIHNQNWEKRTTEQEDEHAKLPDLRLVEALDDEVLEKEPKLRRPNRKPRPGKDAASRYTPLRISEEDIKRYPFRYFYDGLRRCHMRGFKEAQVICEIIVSKEFAEEYRLLLTLVLEEAQSMLNPHSFAETLDFLFHYDDIRYTFAVILDTGAQYLSRSTYWNIQDFYCMSRERLAVTQRSLMQCLVRFAEMSKPTREMQLLAPDGFNITTFHRNFQRWFEEHPEVV